VVDDNGKAELEVLRAIWSEMKALEASLHEELKATRTELGNRIDVTNSRLDSLNDQFDSLRRRATESEVRLATATTELASETRELSHLIREWRDEHRADRGELRERIARIENHLGLVPSQIIEEHERMVLRGADREAFLSAVKNPPAPSKRLVAALRRLPLVVRHFN